MKLARLKLKRTKIMKSMLRDKYGNVKKCGWNQWMKEEIDKLDEEIDKREEEYLLTKVFPNCEN